MTWKPDVCVYHANCNDGFGAAWAVWKRWGDDVQYVPASYGKTLGIDVTGKNVLFVDFSMKATELSALPAKSIVVLDHHKTAEAELTQFNITRNNGRPFTPEDIDGFLRDYDELNRSPIFSYFDMDKSGARLAWEFCHPDTPMPTLLAHIEDRDLWRFAMNGTREVHAGLISWPQDFIAWSQLAEDVTAVWQSGISILRYTRKCALELCAMASWIDIAEHTIPCVNSPFFFASDVGHELLHIHPNAPFAATFFVRDGTRQYSLRSEDARVDVSEIAKQYGGGGHRNAAGFTVNEVPVYL